MRPQITVLDGPGVWMEGEALQQLERVAATPSCVAAVGMPDLHPGPGTPIGATVALERTLWPALLGGDLGCGVRVVTLPKLKTKPADLERRMRAELALRPFDVELDVLMEAVWTEGPRGLAELPGIPEALAELVAEEPAGVGPVGPTPDSQLARQLGSVGGGNHFLELSRVDDVVDPDAAARVGLQKRGYAVIAHSGSRGLGRELAAKWGNVVLDEADADVWLRDLNGSVNFARANRFLLCWRMLLVAGAARLDRTRGSLDLCHNVAERAELSTGPAWLHRKGTAPAYLDQLTVVLGSRGSASWVMRGCGSERCLCSVAHGAGRKYDRASSIALIKQRYHRTELQRTALGGRVLCDDRDALYAEHPDCYKAIEPVVAALETAGAATRVASLHPLFTVKA